MDIKKIGQENAVPADLAQERNQLIAAKLRLLSSCEQLDPRNIIKKHPWYSVTGASAVGAVAAQAPNTTAVRFLATTLTPAISRIAKILSLAAMQLGASLASQKSAHAQPVDEKT